MTATVCKTQEEIVEAIKFNKKLFVIHDCIKQLYLNSENISFNEVDIPGTQYCIGSEGTKVLSDALKSNTSLKELHLGGRNKIGDDGARAIAELLERNTSITFLNLYGNRVGDEGAKALAEALKRNTTLTTLAIDENEIGSSGIKSLAEALKRNMSVKELYIKRNYFGNEGAKAMAEALKQNTALTHVNICDTNFDDEGATALLAAMKMNCTLNANNRKDWIQYFVAKNKCKPEIQKAIENQLEFNQDLVQFLNWPQNHTSLTPQWQSTIVELCCSVDIPTEIISLIIVQIFCRATKLA